MEPEKHRSALNEHGAGLLVLPFRKAQRAGLPREEEPGRIRPRHGDLRKRDLLDVHPACATRVAELVIPAAVARRERPGHREVRAARVVSPPRADVAASGLGDVERLHLRRPDGQRRRLLRLAPERHRERRLERQGFRRHRNERTQNDHANPILHVQRVPFPTSQERRLVDPAGLEPTT